LAAGKTPAGRDNKRRTVDWLQICNHSRNPNSYSLPEF